ncbi:hypothetical protein RAC89_01915 [Paenibacillus sp. GD4]|jgi:hypothetical protein|uniref:hypothetical protein n=1 Tax=Paenibacillus sp. GD4 TaxID=3068890 RepID=UPI00279654DA|nr:hypothetical protein [Paenibacillus sp. GD4]MDQ1909254.1 hypothetical protein [Paenibacillus sp. GD4]
MARNWERMVRRNRKMANKHRQKYGKQQITAATTTEESTVYRGRSWFLPILLVLTGIFCFIIFRETRQDDNLYWITGGSYIFLGLFIFWLRRPYLKVGKDSITSRRFGGDRTFKHDDISEFVFHKDSVTIGFKGKNTRWVFTRMFHRFSIASMQEGLKEFAGRHSIPVKNEA